MLSLVIPVYRNEPNIPHLLPAVAGIAAAIPDGLEAVFVVDGSPDRSWELLRAALPEQPYPARLVLLSRNFGSFAAIRAGLTQGSGDRFAVMAADLQEPPELIAQMDAGLRSGEADVVVGVRDGRSDPVADRVPARLYWALYRRWIVREMPPGGVDVFACTRPFRDELLKMAERRSSLVAQIFWLGYRRREVTYVRRPRKHGRSAWTLGRKVEYLMDSVFAFTDLPIRLLVRAGGLVALLSGVLGLVIASMRLLGAIDVPGYAALALLVVFFGAANVFGLGIVGTYAWRAYENTKDRPLHVVLRTDDFPGAGEGRPAR